jgi:hypothetical protein
MKLSVAPVLVVGAVLLLGSLATSARAATMILHNFHWWRQRWCPAFRVADAF